MNSPRLAMRVKRHTVARLMNTLDPSMAHKLAQAASAFQRQRTGHAPTAVTVVLGDDTLVFTLHDALSPAEKALAATSDGATQVQEFHRQLFASSYAELRDEIKRIVGREVREAAAEVDSAKGGVVHAFTTGTMVQVFQLHPESTEAVALAEAPIAS
jgi:uncharacterized protein YbcI